MKLLLHGESKVFSSLRQISLHTLACMAHEVDFALSTRMADKLFTTFYSLDTRVGYICLLTGHTSLLLLSTHGFGVERSKCFQVLLGR